MAFLFYYMKKHIPNIITSLNLLSGCVGILLVLKGEFTLAFYCVIASGIFDFFDGFVARLLNVKSVIGKELDSLADVISFGLQPAMLMYMLLQSATTNTYLPYVGFLIVIFSALRLAKFNIDERQTSDFIGVNTPMNTFFIFSLPFLAESYPKVIYSPYFLVVITVVTSLLLVSEMKLFAMKLNSLAWKDNKFKYMFLMVAVVLLAIFHFAAIPLIFILYIVFSYLHFAPNP